MNLGVGSDVKALLPRKAMILAAGFGTRLRPLTEAVPKPAVPLCGVPPVLFNLALLAGVGVEEVVVNTHWKPDVIRAAASEGERLGLRIIFSHEEEILGTGGGLAKVADLFEGETFFVLNGKVLYDVDLAAAAADHRELGATATMVLRPYPVSGGFGAVLIDRRRRIVGFRSPEEMALGGPAGCDDQPTPCLFTGVHVLEPGIFDFLPKQGFSCIKSEGYIPMLGAGEILGGHLETRGYWAEPSTPARYLAAVMDLVAGRVDLSRFRDAGLDPFARCREPVPGVRVHEEAAVHPTASLRPPCWVGAEAMVDAGATIGPGAAVEAGARIGKGATVEQSVVWSNAVVDSGESLRGVIAAGADRVSCSSDA